VAIFGFIQLTNLCVQLFGDWGLEIRNAEETQAQVDAIQKNFSLMFMMSAIMPPIYEELVFRMGGVKLLHWNWLFAALISVAFISFVFLVPGYAMVMLIILGVIGGCVNAPKKPKKIKNIYIILITAFVFMLYHHSWSQTIYQLLLGIVFAIIYIKTDNIYYTMLIHFINNAFIIIYTYYTGVGDLQYPVNLRTCTVAVLLAIIACCILRNLIKELPNEQKK
jgi:membrane protease YdiL (CAAX protease family)